MRLVEMMDPRQKRLAWVANVEHKPGQQHLKTEEIIGVGVDVVLKDLAAVSPRRKNRTYDPFDRKHATANGFEFAVQGKAANDPVADVHRPRLRHCIDQYFRQRVIHCVGCSVELLRPFRSYLFLLRDK